MLLRHRLALSEAVQRKVDRLQDLMENIPKCETGFTSLAQTHSICYRPNVIHLFHQNEQRAQNTNKQLVGVLLEYFPWVTTFG